MPIEKKSFIRPDDNREVPFEGEDFSHQNSEGDSWFRILEEKLQEAPYFLDLNNPEDRKRLVVYEDGKLAEPDDYAFQFTGDRRILLKAAYQGKLMVYPLGADQPRQIQAEKEDDSFLCEISGSWKKSPQEPQKPKGMPLLYWLANKITFGYAYKEERAAADAREAAYQEAKADYAAAEKLDPILQEYHADRQKQIQEGGEEPLLDEKMKVALRKMEATQRIAVETINLKAHMKSVEVISDRLKSVERVMEPGGSWLRTKLNDVGAEIKLSLDSSQKILYKGISEHKPLGLSDKDLSVLGLLACGHEHVAGKVLAPGAEADESGIRDRYGKLLADIFSQDTDKALAANMEYLQRGKNAIAEAVNKAAGPRSAKDSEADAFRAKYEADNQLSGEPKAERQKDFGLLGRLLAEGVRRTCDLTMKGPGVTARDITQGKFLGRVVEVLDKHPDVREMARQYGLSDELMQQARGTAAMAHICEDGLKAQSRLADAINEEKTFSKDEATDLIAKAGAMKLVQLDVQESYENRERERKEHMEDIRDEYEVRKRRGSDFKSMAYNQQLQAELREQWDHTDYKLLTKPGALQMELGQQAKSGSEIAADKVQEMKNRQDVKELAEKPLEDIAYGAIKMPGRKAPEAVRQDKGPGKADEKIQKAIDAEKAKAEENYRKLLAEAAKRQKKPAEASPAKPKPTGPVK